MELPRGYREFAAPPALRGTVACPWVRAPASDGSVRVLPDACTDVVWTRGRGVVVAGPDTSAKLASTQPGDLIVGLRFRPGAGGGALGLPLSELRDLRVDARDVDPAFAIDPDEDPRHVAGRLAAAAAARPGDPLVQHAARLLAGDGIPPPDERSEGADVRAAAGALGVSERQLRRRFQAAVGYGPATLARILRFRRFVDAVDRGGDDLATLALDAGYADQAHLTRECRRLAGVTPAALVRERLAG
jgi:AraC-like DNA-binding protein